MSVPLPRIHRLPPELANQIAAGEVVERPASVVKELVENAIDAGARRITIAIELGGKKLIRVEDDGTGMDADDAVLALERHATSKIRHADDLAAISTMGFRGEALPSIASVSHLVLRTRARGTPAGTEIRVNAGVVASVREVGTPEGTIVEVGDLFYNLPARRKFLKADSAEATQVSRIVTQLALCNAAVGFVLTSAGRRVIQVPPVGSLRERFYQLYGERPDLLEVERDTAGVRVTGFIVPLGDQGPTRGPQNIFVNGRIVRDKTIAHAVTAAYSVATVKERSPEVHLFIDLPLDRVDVNVHPAKAEVRFLEQSLVHEVLRRALADTLGSGPAPTPNFQLQGAHIVPLGPGVVAPGLLPGVLEHLTGFRPAYVEAQTEGRNFTQTQTEGRNFSSGQEGAAPPTEGRDFTQTQMEGRDFSPGQPPGDDRQTAIDAVRPMIPLGQFRNTFIIAVDADAVCIIDQHVAHERVLYEQVLERLTTGTLPSQRLLQPVLVDLAPSQRDVIARHAADLERLGFEVGAFGGNSLRICAAPALIAVDEAAAAVRALADDLDGFERGATMDDALRRLAATTACHAAVKANQPLPMEKILHILEELRRTAYSTVCPHGRPVMLRLSRREIEKNFQRI